MHTEIFDSRSELTFSSLHNLLCQFILLLICINNERRENANIIHKTLGVIVVVSL